MVLCWQSGNAAAISARAAESTQPPFRRSPKPTNDIRRWRCRTARARSHRWSSRLPLKISHAASAQKLFSRQTVSGNTSPDIRCWLENHLARWCRDNAACATAGLSFCSRASFCSARPSCGYTEEDVLFVFLELVDVHSSSRHGGAMYCPVILREEWRWRGERKACLFAACIFKLCLYKTRRAFRASATMSSGEGIVSRVTLFVRKKKLWKSM